MCLWKIVQLHSWVLLYPTEFSSGMLTTAFHWNHAILYTNHKFTLREPFCIEVTHIREQQGDGWERWKIRPQSSHKTHYKLTSLSYLDFSRITMHLYLLRTSSLPIKIWLTFIGEIIVPKIKLCTVYCWNTAVENLSVMHVSPCKIETVKSQFTHKIQLSGFF